MAARNDVDWLAVERDFCAGVLSNRQIAKKYALAESAVRKRAQTYGWTRPEAPRGANLVRTKLRTRALAVILPAAGHIEVGRDIARRLLEELDATTSHLGEIEDLITEATKDDANGRRYDAMMKAVSLPTRSLTLKTIAQALNALTEGEKGKKEQKQAEANRVAADGGGWGDDLSFPGPLPN